MLFISYYVEFLLNQRLFDRTGQQTIKIKWPAGLDKSQLQCIKFILKVCIRNSDEIALKAHILHLCKFHSGRNNILFTHKPYLVPS